MRRPLLWAVIVGLGGLPTASAAQAGIIGGMVRNGWSKVPLKRASVTLTTTGSNAMEALTYSESNGAFAFTGVPAGDYTLCASLSGYERACFGGSSNIGSPDAVFNLAPGQLKQDVILALLPDSSISGSVVDQEGDALPDASVRIMRPVYSRRTLHWQNAGQTITNDKGEYHLNFLQPGEYRVGAVGRSQQAVRIRPEAVAGQLVQEDLYVPQYYPGSASVETATSLTLSAGNDLKGIDFTLTTTPQEAVTGVVHLPPGMEKDGSANLLFYAEPRTGSVQTFMFGAGPPDYTFEANVPAGRYRVLTLAHWKNQTYQADQWVDAGPSSTNIVITPTLGTPLSGKLIIEGESQRVHGPYSVHLTSGEDLPNVGPSPTADVSENGTFELPNVFPGIWDIGVNPIPPGSYLKSMRLGDKDVLTLDMKLEEGTRKPLTIVLSTKGSVVSGNLLAKPGVASRVLLAPCGKYEDVLGFYETTVTDVKGHFEFKGVTPGSYRIYAFDWLQLDEYWKPEFLKPYTAAAGEAFTVAEGAHVSHDAPLILRDLGSSE